MAIETIEQTHDTGVAVIEKSGHDPQYAMSAGTVHEGLVPQEAPYVGLAKEGRVKEDPSDPESEIPPYHADQAREIHESVDRFTPFAERRATIVKRVYDRDRQTSLTFEKYLHDRVRKPSSAGENWTETTQPPPTRTEPIYKEITETHRSVEHDGWRFKPFVATGAMFLAATLGVNVDNFVNFVKGKEKQGPDKVTTKTIPAPDPKVIEIESSEQQIVDKLRNSPAEAFSDTEQMAKNSVEFFLTEMDAYEEEGYKVTAIKVVGRASDETQDPASIGRPDQVNQELAFARGAKVVELLQQRLTERGEDASLASLAEAREEILSTDELDVLGVIMQQNGYGSLANLMDAWKAGQLGPDSAVAMDTLFGLRRGAVISAELTLQDEGEPLRVITIVPGEQSTEHNFDPDFIWPIIIPPYPALHVDKTQTTRRVKVGERVIVGDEDTFLHKKVSREADIKIMEPGIIERDDGVNELAPNAWAHTRKYQELLREGRIRETMVFRYQAEHEQPKEIRILFVDHEPSDEEIDNTLESLSLLAQARGGEIFDLLQCISIMPSKEGAANPAEMGLDIDEKADPGTLGLSIPMLGLLEINTNTIEEMSNEEFRHTLIHEGFHALDSNGKGTVYDMWRVMFAGMPEWSSSGGARRQAMEEGSWLWEGIDENGRKVQEQSRTRPKHLSDARRLGPVTNYARTNPLEDFAEAGAVALNREEGPVRDASRVRQAEMDPLRRDALMQILGEGEFALTKAQAERAQEIEATGAPGWSVPIDFPDRLSYHRWSDPLMDPVVGPLIYHATTNPLHRGVTRLTPLGVTVKTEQH